jgi:hypothetical protein
MLLGRKCHKPVQPFLGYILCDIDDGMKEIIVEQVIIMLPAP